MICSVALALLAACGGGGDFDHVETAADAPQADGRATALSASGGTELAANTDSAQLTPAVPSIVETVGTELALSPTASVWLAGIPESPPPAPPLPDPPAGSRTFYVDSRLGNDLNNGLAASQDMVGSGSAGPWRTLARVMQSSLGPGDRLVLACGSVWNETLRVPASGTATRPVVVTAPPEGCAIGGKPTIDGSVSIPASAWTRHQGNIFWATLAAKPTLVVGSPLVEARHPNPGDTSQDGSPYLPLVSDSNVVQRGALQQSPVLNTDPAKLPAGARVTPGTRVRLRVNAWYIHETTVASVNGGKLTLTAPTDYPAKAGWGYMLLGNNAWMLDRPGEWFHDARKRRLYAWMPDSAAPKAALAVVTLPVGVDLQSRKYVTVDGVTVARTSVGVDLQQTTGVQWRNGSIEDSAGACVAAAGSLDAVVAATQISRCGIDAIQGESDAIGEAQGMAVRGNIVRDAGVQMAGETALTSPRRTRGAIVAGTSAVVSDNVIINSGYLGIRIHSGSRVEGNFVYGACSTLDDCGGIYTWQSREVTIRGNVVVRSRGFLHGLPPAERITSAQGIYLDETTVDSLLDNNTVVDADHGIQVHVSSRNTISGNRLLANRRSQIWLQSTRNRENATGDVVGNVITGNQIAAVEPGSVGILLTNVFGPTSAFATINNNQYADRNTAIAVLESTPAGTRAYTLAQWQAATAAAELPAGRDAAGSGLSATPFAPYEVAGANIVPNAGLASDLSGWSTYSARAPQPALLRADCVRGWCLTLQAGGSNSLVASPNFSIGAGQWYRLTVDLLGDQDNQPVVLVVRRGGGGTNGYETLSDRSLQTTAGRTWRRHTVTFQATQTVNARDPVTLDAGARVDIEGLLPGRSITLANLELVPITLDPMALISSALLNASSSEIESACPLPAEHAADCTRLMRLADHSAITWPLRVPARGAVLYYGQDPTLADGDRDGIADSQDSCPGTSAHAAVNAAGCALPVS
jgi:parallel beta-helix repeat protein